MNRKNREAVFRALEPSIGVAMRLRSKFMYDPASHHLLRAVCIESSRFDAEEMRLRVFVQPLYVEFPASHLHYSQGLSPGKDDYTHMNALGADRSRWIERLQTAAREAKSFLGLCETPRGFLENQDRVRGRFRDRTRELEDRWFTQALVGDWSELDSTMLEWQESLKEWKNPTFDPAKERYRLDRLSEWAKAGAEEVAQHLEATTRLMRARLQLD